MPTQPLSTLDLFAHFLYKYHQETINTEKIIKLFQFGHILHSNVQYAKFNTPLAAAVVAAAAASLSSGHVFRLLLKLKVL